MAEKLLSEPLPTGPALQGRPTGHLLQLTAALGLGTLYTQAQLWTQLPASHSRRLQDLLTQGLYPCAWQPLMISDLMTEPKLLWISTQLLAPTASRGQEIHSSAVLCTKVHSLMCCLNFSIAETFVQCKTREQSCWHQLLCTTQNSKPSVPL